MALETAVSDAFTDTNGTDLASHTPEADLESGGWVHVRTSGDSIDIQSNKAEGNLTASSAEWYVIDAGADPATVRVEVTIPKTSGTELSYVIIRSDGTTWGAGTLDGYFLLMGPSVFDIYEVTNASATLRASATSPTVTPGSTYTVTIVDCSNKLTAVGSGAGCAIEYSTSLYSGNQYVGVGLFITGTITAQGKFDNFQVDRCEASGGAIVNQGLHAIESGITA